MLRLLLGMGEGGDVGGGDDEAAIRRRVGGHFQDAAIAGRADIPGRPRPVHRLRHARRRLDIGAEHAERPLLVDQLVQRPARPQRPGRVAAEFAGQRIGRDHPAVRPVVADAVADILQHHLQDAGPLAGRRFRPGQRGDVAEGGDEAAIRRRVGEDLDDPAIRPVPDAPQRPAVIVPERGLRRRGRQRAGGGGFCHSSAAGRPGQSEAGAMPENSAASRLAVTSRWSRSNRAMPCRMLSSITCSSVARSAAAVCASAIPSHRYG